MSQHTAVNPPRYPRGNARVGPVSRPNRLLDARDTYPMQVSGFTYRQSRENRRSLTQSSYMSSGVVGYPRVRVANRREQIVSIAKKMVLGIALAAAATMGGCAETSTHEATGQYVDDSVITAKVKAAIAGEPSLSVSEINVETYKGIVQLSGFVSQASDIPTATRVARGVGGVQSVKNSLQVKK